MWTVLPLLLVLLAGCGAGDASPPPPAAATPTTVAPSAVAAAPIVPVSQVVPRLSDPANTARLAFNFGRSLVWDPGGTAHLVWFEQPPSSDGEHGLISCYRRSTDGCDSWSDPLPIPEAGYPVVAASGNHVYIAFRSKRSGLARTFLVRSEDGGASFTTPLPVSPDEALCGPASVAAEGQHVQVAWMDSRSGPGQCEVYTRHSDDGGRSWDPEVEISPPGGLSWVPSVAVSGSHAYVGWVDLRSGYEVEYLRSSPDGGRTWGPEQQMSEDGSDHWAPNLLADGSRVWMTWFDRTAAGITEVEVNAAADKVLQALHRTYPAPPQRRPDLDFVPAFVTYLSAKADFLQQNVTPDTQPLLQEFHTTVQRWQSGWRIVLRSSTDGASSFGPARRLSEAGPSQRPVLARDGERLDLVWFDRRSGMDQLYLRHSPDAGLNWEPEQLVATPAEASLPCIASHGGRRMVVYLDGREARPQLYQVAR